jgi:hypothetical protein
MEKESIAYLMEFYKKDAAMYQALFKNSEYLQHLGEVTQAFWSYYDKNSNYDKAVYLTMVGSPEKAVYLFNQQNENNLGHYLLARLYLMQSQQYPKNTTLAVKFKETLIKYINLAKPSKQLILLDSTLNSIKNEDWFIAELEKY